MSRCGPLGAADTRAIIRGASTADGAAHNAGAARGALSTLPHAAYPAAAVCNNPVYAETAAGVVVAGADAGVSDGGSGLDAAPHPATRSVVAIAIRIRRVYPSTMALMSGVRKAYISAMRTALKIALVVAVASCGDNHTIAPDADPTAEQVFPFGPFTIEAGQEVTTDCVQITLNNAEDLYVNSIELTTGPGMHHSNWFYSPEADFFGSDGTFTCTDRNFSEPAAAVFGGVVFAQSTQDPHEIQSFPSGVAIRIPAHSKLVAQIHLLNPTDNAMHMTPTIGLTPIEKSSVTTQLAAVSFEDMALALPPQQASRFTVDCRCRPRRRTRPADRRRFTCSTRSPTTTRSARASRSRRSPPTAAPRQFYSTANHIGDTLGGPIDPPFDFTGYTRMRITCDYFNDTNAVVNWGVGNQEMCVFLAFSDSAFDWGGGVTSVDSAGPGSAGSDGVMTFTHACSVYATAATR